MFIDGVFVPSGPASLRPSADAGDIEALYADVTIGVTAAANAIFDGVDAYFDGIDSILIDMTALAAAS